MPESQSKLQQAELFEQLWQSKGGRMPILSSTQSIKWGRHETIEIESSRIFSTHPLWFPKFERKLQWKPAARVASQYLFLSLKPYTRKSPIDHLLVEGFDAEQIWQQIDLLSQPLISSLRRQVRNFEKNPEEIKKVFNLPESQGNNGEDEEHKGTLDLKREGEGLTREIEDEEMEDFDEEEDKDEDDEEEEEEGAGTGIEDKFLKIKELEEFLEEDEAREYGLKRKKKGQRDNDGKIVDEEEEDEEEEDDDEEEDYVLGVMELEDGDEDGEGLGNARYGSSDLFGIPLV